MTDKLTPEMRSQVEYIRRTKPQGHAKPLLEILDLHAPKPVEEAKTVEELITKLRTCHAADVAEIADKLELAIAAEKDK